jgi:hypothetical protein
MQAQGNEYFASNLFFQRYFVLFLLLCDIALAVSVSSLLVAFAVRLEGILMCPVPSWRLGMKYSVVRRIIAWSEGQHRTSAGPCIGHFDGCIVLNRYRGCGRGPFRVAGDRYVVYCR